MTFLKLILCMLLPISAFAEDWIVMRHGLAESNVRGIANGDVRNSSKYPLVELGKQQVSASANELLKKGLNRKNIAAVYVSPLFRTRQTAQIVTDKLQIPAERIHINDKLVDIGLGDLEEQSLKVAEKYLGPSHQDFSRAKEYRGESPAQLIERMRAFVQEVRSQHHKGYVLVITHGTPARYFLNILDPENPRSSHPEPAEFVILNTK